MHPVSTVNACVQRGARVLAESSGSSRLDAELLLSKVLGLTRSALVVHGAHCVTPDQCLQYENLLAERAAGSPLAYLTGHREFWSLDLEVTPDVLVPRPETELLVELALQHVRPDRSHTVVDLGTGSGAIALAIASERPLANIIAVDLSPRAVSVARANADRLGFANIDCRQGSWFEALQGASVDLIVSNPPYVSTDDPALAHLHREPTLALLAGPTGLDALRAIAGEAAAHLNAGGWLFLEHGHTQAGMVQDLLRHHGFAAIASHADLSGKPRVTFGTVHHTKDTHP